MTMENGQTRRPERTTLPHVVIVGGGFGGLYAARALGRAPVRITLIDRHNYHLFRPMLYQVATGLLSADEVAAPIRSILRKQKNTEVRLAEVTGVDKENRRVLMGDDSLSYDYLILATGIHYNYFGHEEWKPFAPSLTSIADADRIRGKILQVFETAERLAAEGRADAALIQAWLTFVLVGAGPTGVEMAGAIAELSRAALAGDFRYIDPRSTRIILFEAAPRILGAFPEALAEKSRRRLEKMGVEVRTGTAVLQVDAEGVLVGGERIRSKTVLWTAGVIASPAGKWLGAEVDKAGRVKVNPDLSVPGHPELFVIGDTASVVAPVHHLFGVKSRQPQRVPGLAPPAIQGGQYVARLIIRRLRGQPPPGPFEYLDKGSLAIVGRDFAIADFKTIRLWGWPAWWLWLGAHIFFLIGFANRVLVLTQWAISFLSNRRGVRVFPPEQEETAARATETSLPAGSGALSGASPAGGVRIG
jgi:NADH:quinone reductase (non-electrogenic)